MYAQTEAAHRSTSLDEYKRFAKMIDSYKNIKPVRLEVLQGCLVNRITMTEVRI